MSTNDKQAVIGFGISVLVVVVSCVSALIFWANRAHAASVKSKCPVHWIIKETSAEYAPYKNARLIEYQDMLCDRGITESKSLKYLTADILQENGALSENVNGDNGCSIGIPQRNICNSINPLTHRYFRSAAEFKRVYPAWNDYKTQLHWLADNVQWRDQKFDGNIFRIVVYHNSPAAAARNKDSCRYIGNRWSCYFWGEVSQHISSLQFI